MIDPKLLTEEAGFVDGVVVEYKYSKVDKRYIDILNVSQDGKIDTQEYFLGQFEDMEYIRPLTGPMSIWLHAPEWATYLIQGGGEFCFGIKIPNWWDGESSKIQLRPWWAITQKERE